MATSTVMRMLEDRVPLTLIIDLIDARHLPSRAILRREGGDLDWLDQPTEDDAPRERRTPDA